MPSYPERRQHIISEAEQIIFGPQLEQAMWTDAAVYGLSDKRVWEFLENATSLEAWRWALSGRLASSDTEERSSGGSAAEGGNGKVVAE